MTKYNTNREKMLNSVLLNKRLMEVGGYGEKDFISFDEAIVSENPVVRTVARIINGHSKDASTKNIYNEITDFLKKKL